MEKKDLLLLLTATVTGGVACFSKNKTVRTISQIVSLASSGVILYTQGKMILQKTIKEVNQECDEVERMVERSGVNVDLLKEDQSSHENSETGVSISIETLFKQSREIFSEDAFLHFAGDHTLHILQYDEKIVFGIQLPKPKNEDNFNFIRPITQLSSQDVYLFFKDMFIDYAEGDELGVLGSSLKIYQRGFKTVDIDNKRSYEPIEKLDGEDTREYVKRVNSVIEAWIRVDSYKRSLIKECESEGKDLIDIDSFMFIEFPIQRDGDLLPGMTVTKTMWLIRELMEPYYEIKNRSGVKCNFSFENILFHLGDNLAKFYAYVVDDDDDDKKDKDDGKCEWRIEVSTL